MVHACDLCDKVFLRKDALSRHVKTHDNEERRSRKRPSSNSLCVEACPGAESKRERQWSSEDEPLPKRERTTERQFHQRDTGFASKPNNSSQSTTITDNKDAQRGSTDFLTNQQPSVSETGIFADPGVSSTDHEPTVSEHQSTKPTLTWHEEPVICPENVTLPDPFGLAEHCDTHDLHKLYKKYWRDIRTRFQMRGRLRNTYNFRSHTYTIEEVMGAAKQIFEKQETAFKINVGFGFFLRNVETCQLQYYYASNNTQLLPEPMLVTGQSSFTKFLNALSSRDPADHVRLARPNSKWVVEMVTNATFYVFKLRDHPIGGATRLPEFITNNKAVVSLERDRHNNNRYEDNLCLFRCLALHKGASVKTLEKKSRKLYEQMYSVKPKTFKGVPLSKLHDVETFFQLNIVVYELIQPRENPE
ncbi:hypothetical protein HOLleu_42799 [Holothuria leucospilota]|uniref:C2H2-type domain-containing protein n=1 Tax=Holothuria leucospilota TaxID=206669 RepID=A0A9Q1BBF6_HOLLE|nr:hypothetical protein HOLleu_42799 [Holothuria leucospilota]